MKNLKLLTIIYVSIATLSLMYITQPIQPLLAREFEVPLAKASLLTSAILLPLALAPILYGYLLEKSSSKRLLIFSLTSLGVLQIALAFVDRYEPFLTLRFLQALFIPAVLTTILTILTRIDTQNIQRYVSIYVASTVVGGLAGRLGGSYFATLYSWQATFAALGVLVLLGAYMVSRLESSAPVTLLKLTPRDIIESVKDPRYALLFFTVFILFFSFQGILNFLPFRAKELDPDIKESLIGLLYLGYSVGVVVSILATPITRLFGSKERAILFGLLLFAFSTTLTLSPHLTHLIASVFVLCAGMFIAHSILSSLTNSLSSEKKGITNGLYLAFYYSGGTIGSIAPGVIYKHFGWGAFALFIGAMLLLASALFYHYQSILRQSA